MAELTDEEKFASVQAIQNAETLMNSSKMHANCLVNIHNQSNQFGHGKTDQSYLSTIIENFALDAAENKFLKYELLLAGQVTILNAIFCDMAVKMGNSEQVATIEAVSRIALKAQDNTRKTIMALKEMKAPKSVTFVKQQK